MEGIANGILGVIVALVLLPVVIALFGGNLTAYMGILPSLVEVGLYALIGVAAVGAVVNYGGR